jgi:hypothetical protein
MCAIVVSRNNVTVLAPLTLRLASQSTAELLDIFGLDISLDDGLVRIEALNCAVI